MVVPQWYLLNEYRALVKLKNRICPDDSNYKIFLSFQPYCNSFWNRIDSIHSGIQKSPCNSGRSLPALAGSLNMVRSTGDEDVALFGVLEIANNCLNYNSNRI